MQNEPTFKGNESSCICEKPKGRHKKHCDAYRLSEFLLKASLPMQKNEPQLSAEMLAKLQQTFPNLDMATGNGFVHFLATALEEQRAEERAKAIGEVEAHYQEMSCTLFDPDYLEGVRASIEIMKGKS